MILNKKKINLLKNYALCLFLPSLNDLIKNEKNSFVCWASFFGI